MSAELSDLLAVSRSGAYMSTPLAFVSAQVPASPEPFVDADTAAAFLQITRRTLLQKVRAGKIPGYPLDPDAAKKEWRFKLSELDRCLCSPINSRVQPPEPFKRRA